MDIFGFQELNQKYAPNVIITGEKNQMQTENNLIPKDIQEQSDKFFELCAELQEGQSNDTILSHLKHIYITKQIRAK